ncbi:MAG: DUF5665 domain-containing protein [bacterium]
MVDDGLLQSLNSRVQKLADAIEHTRIDEYTSMMIRPWKFFFFNFLVGIFRGVGIAIGMTIIAAILIYVLSQAVKSMIDLPVVGMYFDAISQFLNQFVNQGIQTR